MPLEWVTDFPSVCNTSRGLPFLRIFDVGVYEQAVHLRMNVLNENLKAIETTSFWDLHLLTKTCHLPKPESTAMSTVNPVLHDSTLSLMGETTDLYHRRRMGAVQPYFIHRYVHRTGVVQNEIKQASYKLTYLLCVLVRELQQSMRAHAHRRTAKYCNSKHFRLNKASDFLFIIEKINSTT